MIKEHQVRSSYEKHQGRRIPLIFHVPLLVCMLILVLAALAALITHKLDGSSLPTLQAANRCDNSENSSQGVTYIKSNNILCLYGLISKNMALKVLSNDVDYNAIVVINSSGGDVKSAIDIAEYLQQRKVSIIVNHYCLSSCANYVFISGNEKYVLPGSYVGFHGGPSLSATLNYNGPPEFYNDAIIANRLYTSGLLRRQSTLFAQAGVSESLIYTPMLYDNKGKPNPQTMFWEYGPNILANKFGVKGIKAFETPDDASLLSKLEARVSGIVCQKTNDDVWQCRV